jgi:hypothetical protein
MHRTLPRGFSRMHVYSSRVSVSGKSRHHVGLHTYIEPDRTDGGAMNLQPNSRWSSRHVVTLVLLPSFESCGSRGRHPLVPAEIKIQQSPFRFCFCFCGMGDVTDASPNACDWPAGAHNLCVHESAQHPFHSPGPSASPHTSYRQFRLS